MNLLHMHVAVMTLLWQAAHQSYQNIRSTKFNGTFFKSLNFKGKQKIIYKNNEYKVRLSYHPLVIATILKKSL